MKILKLNLLAFGPFTETALDFSTGGGLHLIYGPNEAGKSSALRAVRQMLYGIHAQTDDNFLHPYQRLRIGGLLEHSDGEKLAFVRRKGLKNTLRDGEDDAPLDESELRRFLGGVDQNQFGSMFGIDYEQLVAGGKAIISGDGDMGQILFAAGAGMADLHAVQKQLREELDALFKPTGSLPRINKALAELKEARETLKSAQVTTREWTTHNEALKDARRRRAQVEEEIARL